MKFLIFQKIDLSSPKLKKHISGENLQSLKIKLKILLKVVSNDVFSIFTTVKHREIPSKTNFM